MVDESKELQEWSNLDVENMNLDQAESQLESELQSQLDDLHLLEEDRKKINNPDALGETVLDVVWQQVVNQIGVQAGEDFIKENRGLPLDLRDSAHIQTTEDFAKGKIVTHNTEIDYKKRYKDWQSNFQRNEDGTIKETYDRINGEYVAVLRNKTDKSGENYNHNYNAREYIDAGRPIGSASMHKDHTISAAETIRNPEANAHLSREEQADFANSDVNLIDLDASANDSKRDHRMELWLDSERDGKKPAERFNIDEEELRQRDRHAREEFEKVKKEGEKRSIDAGRKSQVQEAARIGGKALRAVVMGLLASLLKDIIRKLVLWFRSGQRNFQAFIDSVKAAIRKFITNLKEKLITATDTFVTTIATAIWGPIVGLLKKAFIFLKQGYKSLKEAIDYIRKPENREKSFSVLMLEVGKIVIAGLAAGGAIVLGEVIEKTLITTVPVFAIQIPFFGSLASIIGIFLGAVVSGIIGALALRMIDKVIAKKQIAENEKKQVDQKNEIIVTQDKVNLVAVAKTNNIKVNMARNVAERHESAASAAKEKTEQIVANESY